MENNEEYPILTEKSFLRVMRINDLDLYVKKAVKEIQGKLIEKPEIKICGKICHQQRNVGFFSNESEGYRYSGQIIGSQPLSKYLKKLLRKINQYFSANFNGILVNEYLDGDNYIGAHSDDEDGLDDTTDENRMKIGIVAISYGATRTFRIRDKTTKKIVTDVPTNSGDSHKLYDCTGVLLGEARVLTKFGDIIQMGGDFQNEFTHEIPPTKKIHDSRISFTFRRHTK
jgi:alkylated DNA repair dioxygenase AlkB